MDYVNKIKNEIFIHFEDTLNISKYVDIDCENNINLYAKINHQGEFEFGIIIRLLNFLVKNFGMNLMIQMFINWRVLLKSLKIHMHCFI